MPDMRLCHRVHGEGRPALVFHGLPGVSHTSMSPWLDDLADALRLVYFDPSGCGLSPRPADIEELTVARWVADAEDVRRALGLEQVVVLGLSFGGCLALEYALAHPERVAGAVVWGCAPSFSDPDAPARAQARTMPAALAALQAAVSGNVAEDSALGGLVRDTLPLYLHRPDPRLIGALADTIVGSAATWNHAYTRMVPAYSLANRLGAVRCPVLVLAGRSDWLTPPSQAQRLVDELPHAELCVLEESGHFAHAEEPARFASTVREFLRRLPGP